MPPEKLRARREEILEPAHRHGAEKVRVFGSVVHGAAGAGSAVDFLVRFRNGTRLLDQVASIRDLESLLGRDVDVVCEPSLHRLIRPKVPSQAVPLRAIPVKYRTSDLHEPDRPVLYTPVAVVSSRCFRSFPTPPRNEYASSPRSCRSSARWAVWTPRSQ